MDVKLYPKMIIFLDDISNANMKIDYFINDQDYADSRDWTVTTQPYDLVDKYF